jgi:Tfp pilus assembly protein PilN
MIEINLLPKELQIQGPRLALGRGMIIPAAGMVVLVAAMIGLSFYQKNQLAELDNKINIARARAEQLQKDIRMVDALVDIKGKITARIDAVKVLDLNRTTWVSVMEDLSDRIPEFLWMTALRETGRVASSNPVPGESAAPVVVANAQLVPTELEGYAYSLSGLANLIVSMRNSGYFKQVDLSSAREVKLDSHPAYSFALTCQLDYSGIPNPDKSLDSGDNDHLALQSAPTE